MADTKNNDTKQNEGAPSGVTTAADALKAMPKEETKANPEPKPEPVKVEELTKPPEPAPVATGALDFDDDIEEEGGSRKTMFSFIAGLLIGALITSLFI